MNNNKHPLLNPLITIIFIIVCNTLQGQDQSVADSLKKVIITTTKIDSQYLEHLEDISYHESDPRVAERYADTLISLADELGYKENLLSGHLQKGNADLHQGNTTEALESFFSSLEVALEIKANSKAGAIYSSIADVYNLSDDFNNANKFYAKSISILRTSDDTVSLATALLNVGDNYINQELHDTALVHLIESAQLFEVLDFEIGIGYAIGNIGMAYKGLNENAEAEKNFLQAIEILYQYEDYYPVSVYYSNLADIYFERDQLKTAFEYAQKSLDLAEGNGFKEQLSEAYSQLSQLHEHNEEYEKAHDYLKKHFLYRDSIVNVENEREKAEMRADFDIQQKQVQVDLLEQQKENQRITIIATIITAFLLVLLAIGLYRRYRFTQKTKKIIEYEKNRSDNLLLNILPEETAHELKENGKVQAKRFDSVTVLFTDFKGFTKYAEDLDPEALVESVDYYFSKFDEIIEKHGLEKIKTVGDAYMCAGGLPYPTEDHAEKMLTAALEISDFVNQSLNSSNGKTRFEIRIGVNTGPVVAGVVGTKKFAYDIWGDTVNIASRMETNSVPGRINISEQTYNIVKEKFDCEYRGELDVKNRGQMKMYFVNGTHN